jgi:hypothetical protein
MTVEETLSVVDGFKALNVSSMTSVEKAAITLAAEVRRQANALRKIADLDHKNAGANAAHFAHKIAAATLAGKF